MTACLYMRAKDMPLLLSDIVVTRETDDLDDLNLPGALIRGSRIGKFKSTHVNRKVYFLSDNLAVACAGTVKYIEEFFEEVLGLGEVLSNPECVELIYEILKKYEAPAKDVEALICYESPQIYGASAPTGSQHTIEGHLDFFVSGSGGEDVANIVKYDFEMFDRCRWESATPYDLISNFAGRISSRMIGNEILFGYGKDWGGFAEWATYDYKNEKWSYAPPTLHCFVLAVPLPNKRFTLEQSRYWFCYNNDDEAGNSAILGLRVMKEALVYQWTLDSILSPEPPKQRALVDWNGWKPEEVVVQVFPYGKRELGSLFVTAGNFLGNDFNIQDGHVSVGIRQELIDQWGQTAARGWGLEYVSMTDLNDEQMDDAFNAALSDGWDK